MQPNSAAQQAAGVQQPDGQGWEPACRRHQHIYLPPSPGRRPRRCGRHCQTAAWPPPGTRRVQHPAVQRSNGRAVRGHCRPEQVLSFLAVPTRRGTGLPSHKPASLWVSCLPHIYVDTAATWQRGAGRRARASSGVRLKRSSALTSTPWVSSHSVTWYAPSLAARCLHVTIMPGSK